jgi:hypothetical protein
MRIIPGMAFAHVCRADLTMGALGLDYFPELN